MDANMVAVLVVAIPAIASVAIAYLNMRAIKHNTEKIDAVHEVVNGRSVERDKEIADLHKEVQYLNDMLSHKNGTL